METRRLRLREARIKAGLTQRALGEAVGCDPAYVSRTERGVQRPSFGYLYAVADVLDLWPLKDLLDQLWRPADSRSRQRSKEQRRRRQSSAEEGR